MRLVTNPKVKVFGYPRFDDPNFVNWVDYDKALNSADPTASIARLLGEAAGKPLYLVTAAGYAQAGYTCAALRGLLDARFPHEVVVNGDNKRFYQSMNLIQYGSRETLTTPHSG